MTKQLEFFSNGQWSLAKSKKQENDLNKAWLPRGQEGDAHMTDKGPHWSASPEAHKEHASGHLAQELQGHAGRLRDAMDAQSQGAISHHSDAMVNSVKQRKPELIDMDKISPHLNGLSPEHREQIDEHVHGPAIDNYKAFHDKHGTEKTKELMGQISHDAYGSHVPKVHQRTADALVWGKDGEEGDHNNLLHDAYSGPAGKARWNEISDMEGNIQASNKDLGDNENWKPLHDLRAKHLWDAFKEKHGVKDEQK